MTITEAKEVFLNRGFVKVNNGEIYDPDKWRQACSVISEWLKKEPKTGHWIKTLKEDITECMAGSGYVFMCSECKKWENHPKSFCPNCGAEMFSPQESEGKE